MARPVRLGAQGVTALGIRCSALFGSVFIFRNAFYIQISIYVLKLHTMNQSKDNESTHQHFSVSDQSQTQQGACRKKRLRELECEEASSFRHLNYSHARLLIENNGVEPDPIPTDVFFRIREGKLVRITFDMLTPEELISIQHERETANLLLNQKAAALDGFILPNVQAQR
jgi:hypothetical protein